MIHIPDSIFPKNSDGQPICSKCRNLIAVCSCPVLEYPRPKSPAFTAKVCLDTGGRKGKAVTLIEGLPGNEIFLKNLAKTLKTKTGSGGTCYVGEQGGVIEIQGDHVKKIREWLKEEFREKQ